jgi:hypothetical protein
VARQKQKRVFQHNMSKAATRECPVSGSVKSKPNVASGHGGVLLHGGSNVRFPAQSGSAHGPPTRTAMADNRTSGKNIARRIHEKLTSSCGRQRGVANTDGLFLTRKPPPARSLQTQPVTPFRPPSAVTVSVGNSHKIHLCCQYVGLYVFCFPLYL